MEEKGWFCPIIFQLYEQKNNLPDLEVCLAENQNWLLLKGFPTFRPGISFLRQLNASKK